MYLNEHRYFSRQPRSQADCEGQAGREGHLGEAGRTTDIAFQPGPLLEAKSRGRPHPQTMPGCGLRLHSQRTGELGLAVWGRCMYRRTRNSGVLFQKWFYVHPEDS